MIDELRLRRPDKKLASECITTTCSHSFLCSAKPTVPKSAALGFSAHDRHLGSFSFRSPSQFHFVMGGYVYDLTKYVDSLL